MPLVGSSNMSMSQLLSSHLDSTTFCWLPPDRLRTLLFTLGVFVRTFLTYSWDTPSIFLSSTKATLEN